MKELEVYDNPFGCAASFQLIAQSIFSFFVAVFSVVFVGAVCKVWKSNRLLANRCSYIFLLLFFTAIGGWHTLNVMANSDLLRGLEFGLGAVSLPLNMGLIVIWLINESHTKEHNQ